MFDNGCKNTVMETLKHYRVVHFDSALTIQDDLDNRVKQLINTMLYLNDKDKVNADIETIENYVVKHREINFLNYKLCIKDIPLYSKIEEIQTCGMFLNTVRANNELSISVGSIIANRLYNGKLTPTKALKRATLNFQKNYRYVVTQFYDNLWNVLEIENRTREWSSPSMTIEEFLKHYKSN